MKHIIFFSSGIGSWAAAKRVAERYGVEDLILLFADTGVEDADNYRFLKDAAINVFDSDPGERLVVVKSDRDSTVFENWRSRRAIANNQMPFCSFDLKHKPCRDWLKVNSAPEDIYYVGIDWSEVHRMPKITAGWAPNKVEAPLVNPPYLDKTALLNWAIKEGLQPPRLYSYGLPHSNCGGGCVRAGIGHWRHIYKVLPEVFAKWEAEETAMRDRLGKDVSMLKREVNGQRYPLPLSQLRTEIEADGQLDLLDWGGCGCFVEGEL